MVKQAAKQFDAPALDAQTLAYWEANQCYQKTKAHRANGPDFYFVDGPPYTSGYIHIGTAWNKVLKDSYVRYLRMNGYNVRDQPGYDMHGLPIEVRVEKDLGIKNKNEIEQYGVDKFVGKCREFALKFQKAMDAEFKAIGVWFDWDNPYRTIENYYIEAAWWTLKRAAEKGLLYQSERGISCCPRCGTALAEAEVEYWDENDASIYVKFPLKGKQNEFLVIWTTTPWTLPANMAVCAHPDFSYAKVLAKKRVDGKLLEEILIVLDGKVEEIMELGQYDEHLVLEHFSGKEIEGLEYVHPFADVMAYHRTPKGKWHCKVILGGHVTGENTGLVHTAPGHGAEDAEVGAKYGIPQFSPVMADGKYTDEVEPYAGMYVRDANAKVIDDLKRKGLMLNSGLITHRYGHCWRCKTPILYRTTRQWFVRITQLKDKMLSEVDRVKWTPEWAGSLRERDWVSNARDWCITRQRYWGIPLPIWKCDKCGELHIVGSAKELREISNCGEIELHRPWVDGVAFKCKNADCDGTMRREPDVLDVWFDSAVSSWAQLKYPAETKEFERWWPCKWITEAQDQTRGWFYSQLGAGVMAFGRAPYDEVLMHGWALDEKGQAMSKSIGNVISPMDVIKKYGVDAMRFYIMRSSAPWEDLPFSWNGVLNANRNLNVLWNVVVFSTTYMALDKFDPAKTTFESVKKNLRVEDRWLYSRIENLKKTVTENIKIYNMHLATRAIEEFTLNDLSRWYVRLVRDRTWVEGDDLDKLAAYRTLYDALMDVAKLMAPFTPFISEQIFQNLDGSLATVHMCDWPKLDESLIDAKLEESMSVVRDLVEAAANARQKAQIKLRWPVKRIIVASESPGVLESIESLESLVKDQINVKKVELVRGVWGELKVQFVPKQGAIGPIFKKDAGTVLAALKVIDPNVLKDALAKGNFMLDAADNKFEITPEMVEFLAAMPEKIAGAGFSGGTIYIDTEITDEIKGEGMARDVIRRIQEMRKEADLKVEDFIVAGVAADEEMVRLLAPHKETIASETRCKSLLVILLSDDTRAECDNYSLGNVGGELKSHSARTKHESKYNNNKDWDIEGQSVKIGISKT